MSFFKKFKEEEYLKANPDVAIAVEKGILKSGEEHYLQYGKKEGRQLKGKPIFSRNEKIFFGLNKEGLGLEIGPSHNPVAPKKQGFNVHILDHLSADDLRKKYEGHEKYGVKLENIEEVDFVWSGQRYCELVGHIDYYDWIIASHVIEHVPDFIGYLRQCEELLSSEGCLSLVIPDKRYCFDYFSPRSSTGEILDAFYQKRVKPSPGQIFNQIANAVKCGEQIAWSKDSGDGKKSLLHNMEQARSLLEEAITGTSYIDAHCWRFTPASFRLLISDLNQLGLISMSIKHEFDTEGCEFYVTLEKNDFDNLESKKNRIIELENIKKEER